MMVSRLVATEAIVKVQGLDKEILIPDIDHFNRALQGDVVCI